MTIQQAKQLLKPLGITLTKLPIPAEYKGQLFGPVLTYRVKGRATSEPYFTDDLEDAVRTGLEMGQNDRTITS